MPNVSTHQTSFTAGEIDPRLIGRTDLKAYEQGAAVLENVWVTTAGSVKRRSGTRHVATVPSPGRLVGILGQDQVHRLFVLGDGLVHLFENGALVTSMEAPWVGTQLAALSYATYGNGLLVCHPQLRPQQVITDPFGNWRVFDWLFETAPASLGGQLLMLQPYAKYAPAEATLEASPGTGSDWTFTSNQAVFSPGHVGTRLRFRGIEIAVSSVGSDRKSASGEALGEITDPSRTGDWEEQAFSPAAGYPNACIMFQERLVVGGVPAKPNHLWMSKIGRPFDFDTGSGLDDEAINFSLGDDPAHAIRAFSAGRELEVFTAASEWTIDGNPLAPASTIALKQTGIGFIAKRHVPPIDVDGASVFVGRGGDSLIEYVFADIDTAYQAQNLAVRARHLLSDPVDLGFDAGRRLLVVVNDGGELAIATLDRNAQMVAWSRHATDGRFLAVEALGGELYLLVDRGGGVCLERLDDGFLVDAGVALTASAPQTAWSGLDHLDGREVAVIGDGLDLGMTTVVNGSLLTSQPVKTLQVGLTYRHAVEPLPLIVRGRPAELYRPLEMGFQLLETAELAVDVGEGLRSVTLATTNPVDGLFSGLKRVRARGWRRGATRPLWRIEAERPLPFQLLSATSDVKVTR